MGAFPFRAMCDTKEQINTAPYYKNTGVERVVVIAVDPSPSIDTIDIPEGTNVLVITEDNRIKSVPISWIHSIARTEKLSMYA